MKIVFITHYTELYGANRSLINLIEGLKEFKVQSLVLCPQTGALTEELQERNINFIVVRYFNWYYQHKYEIWKTPLKLAATFLLLPFYYSKIAKFDPDILYTNSSVNGLGAFLAITYKKPHVWHIREFGESDYGFHYQVGNKGLEFFLNKSAAVITISKALYKEKLQKIRTKTHIIYNGIIPKDKIPTKSRKMPDQGPVILGIVGFVHPQKNQEEALKALCYFNQKYGKAKLLIVGDGSKKYIKHLKNFVKENQQEADVEFMGHQKEISKIYQTVDILLMCSRNEGMGRVTVEAMAQGIPVIGHNSAATPEIIDDNVNGLLYKDGYKDLSKKISDLYLNPDLYETLSKNAQVKVHNCFTQETYAKKIYDVLCTTYKNFYKIK